MSDEEPGRWSWLLTRLLLLLVLISVPFGLLQVYRSMTALPETVRIATGAEGGRYREVMEAIGRELQQRTGIQCEFVASHGTLDNMRHVVTREADFALIQSGVPVPDELDSDALRSVSNVYSETVLLVVRSDSGITDGTQLAGRSVSMGLKDSGEYVAAVDVLQHLGLAEGCDESQTHCVDARYLDYKHVIEGFRSKQLDAAIMTVGLDAKVLNTLAADQSVEILSIPYADAFVYRHPSYRSIQVAAGTFQTHPHVLPAKTVHSVAVTSQLVAREDISNRLVLEVAKIVTDRRFQRKMQLRELFAEGIAFARNQTWHPLHGGAVECFEPELKPLLPTDFVEATEGIRSFVVSSLIAVWLLLRWYRDHRSRVEEHQLDAYIRKLMTIERRQMELDEGNSGADVKALQKLLDEVTGLRQEALRELTANELNDDPAASSFISMCHALSEKISAKLTRQRFDAAMRELGDRLTKSNL